MDINELLKEFERLNKANNELKNELRANNKSINAIKTGNIDALVVKNKNELKVYTEAAADKTYRILIEEMNEGALTLSKTGIILYCNLSFAKMIEYPLQKVIGIKLKKFIADSSKDAFDLLLKKGKDKNAKGEVGLCSTDGKVIAALMSINTISIDDKSIYSIIFSDLTIPNENRKKLNLRTKQLVQTKEELEIANIDLEAFNYISSHDLQEPLRKIQNFVALITTEDRKKLSVAGIKYFKSLQETARQMQMLIDDLHKYSRARNTSHKFETIKLNTIIEEVIKEYEIIIVKEKAEIVVKNLCEIRMIRFQFYQLFDHLFSNSFKFSKSQQSPQITIESRKGKGKSFNEVKLSPNLNYCHISFIDKGVGFDPQYRDRIFKIFQRLHSTEDYKGTGIGLSICKRIVENHNGVITATSEVNKGVRFDIYIPS